jgi:hypothetical protein
VHTRPFLSKWCQTPKPICGMAERCFERFARKQMLYRIGLRGPGTRHGCRRCDSTPHQGTQSTACFDNKLYANWIALHELLVLHGIPPEHGECLPDCCCRRLCVCPPARLCLVPLTALPACAAARWPTRAAGWADGNAGALSYHEACRTAGRPVLLGPAPPARSAPPPLGPTGPQSRFAPRSSRRF